MLARWRKGPKNRNGASSGFCKQDEINRNRERCDLDCTDDIESSHSVPQEQHISSEMTSAASKEFNNLILQQRFVEASSYLIMLEHKYSSKANQSEEDLGKELKDVEMMYKVLLEQVSDTVTSMLTIADTNPQLLKNAVNTIIQEEQEDEKYVTGKTCTPSSRSRPRKWKVKCLSSLRNVAFSRLNEFQSYTSVDSDCSVFQHLIFLGKQVKQDLIFIITHVKPCFPEEYRICFIFSMHFHEYFSSEIKQLMKKIQLEKKVTHSLLCWILNFYPNDILKSKELVNHIDEAELGSLIPTDMILELEKRYFDQVMEDSKMWMHKSLQQEEDEWKRGNIPEKLNGSYHSELAIDIIEIIHQAEECAKQICPLIGESMLYKMLTELVLFLKSYKKSVETFEEKCVHQKNYIPVISANVNNCFHLRSYIDKCKTEYGIDAKYMSNMILKDIEEKGLKLLSEPLFLKENYTKLLSNKWQSGSDSMNTILTTTDQHLQDFSGLKAPDLQEELLRKTHLYIVATYISHLLKRKLRLSCPDMQQTLAEEILQDVHDIEILFQKHDSNSGFLNQALRSIAEIIALQHIDAIKIEVCNLVREYPDIRKRHVLSILRIKDNMTGADRRSILNVLSIVERNAPSEMQELFSHVLFENNVLFSLF
ncbi:tumor necrosis factor alpha-induced protein 2-like [Protopterus annectens]|uniref:tumor necrosis factor alpha-induced protein 2-like n=1 Tax=Protopterus annectens TaxID=7888 RepID=UPI001CFAF36E|nr:tumor necrosis factor alpha-induced protein 2-like [Protopterus annectens]